MNAIYGIELICWLLCSLLLDHIYRTNNEKKKNNEEKMIPVRAILIGKLCECI